MTSAVGEVTLKLGASAFPVGLAVSVDVGAPLVYGEIDTNQDPNYNTINDGQNPGWASISVSQSPAYQEINDGQSPGWASISVSQSPGYQEIDAGRDAA